MSNKPSMTNEPSMTNSPSMTNTPTPEQGYVFCGKWGNTACGVNEALVFLTEVHAVRCCSTNATLGDPSTCISGSYSGVIYGWTPPNCLNQTYYQAKETCEDSGRRLCSREEMEASCTQNTGCLFNNELAWGYVKSSSPSLGPSGAPSSNPSVSQLP